MLPGKNKGYFIHSVHFIFRNNTKPKNQMFHILLDNKL